MSTAGTSHRIRSSGFTLVEQMVVIVIIGITMTLGVQFMPWLLAESQLTSTGRELASFVTDMREATVKGDYRFGDLVLKGSWIGWDAEGEADAFYSDVNVDLDTFNVDVQHSFELLDGHYLLFAVSDLAELLEVEGEGGALLERVAEELRAFRAKDHFVGE